MDDSLLVGTRTDGALVPTEAIPFSEIEHLETGQPEFHVAETALLALGVFLAIGIFLTETYAPPPG